MLGINRKSQSCLLLFVIERRTAHLGHLRYLGTHTTPITSITVCYRATSSLFLALVMPMRYIQHQLYMYYHLLYNGGLSALSTCTTPETNTHTMRQHIIFCSALNELLTQFSDLFFWQF